MSTPMRWHVRLCGRRAERLLLLSDVDGVLVQGESSPEVAVEEVEPPGCFGTNHGWHDSQAARGGHGGR